MPFLEEFSTICCDQHKGFSIVNEADVFLEFFCFFYDPMGVGNLISDSSDFLFHLEYLEFLSSHTFEHSLQNFEHYFASICNECNWAVVEHSLALLTGVQPWWIQGIRRGDNVGEQDTIKLKIQDQIRSVVQSCPTLCNPMNRSMPGLPVHHQLLEFTQTHIHRVSDAIQPSYPLSSPSPPAPNPSQHQSLFQ